MPSVPKSLGRAIRMKRVKKNSQAHELYKLLHGILNFPIKLKVNYP
jgi:hypothetical protein